MSVLLLLHNQHTALTFLLFILSIFFSSLDDKLLIMSRTLFITFFFAALLENENENETDSECGLMIKIRLEEKVANNGILQS